MSLIPYSSDEEDTAIVKSSDTSTPFDHIPVKALLNIAGTVSKHTLSEKSFKRLYYEELKQQRLAKSNPPDTTISAPYTTTLSSSTAPPLKQSRTGPSEVRCVFHGESLTDFLGRSWLSTSIPQPPTSLVTPSNLKQSLVLDEKPSFVSWIPNTMLVLVCFSYHLEVYDVRNRSKMVKMMTCYFPFMIAHVLCFGNFLVAASLDSIILIDLAVAEIINQKQFDGLISSVGHSNIDPVSLYVALGEELNEYQIPNFQLVTTLIEDHGKPLQNIRHLPPNLASCESRREFLLTFSNNGILVIRTRNDLNNWTFFKTINTSSLSKRSISATSLLISPDFSQFFLTIPEMGVEKSSNYEIFAYNVSKLTEKRDKYRQSKIKSTGLITPSHSSDVLYSALDNQLLVISTIKFKPIRLLKSIGKVVGVESHHQLPFLAVISQSELGIYGP
ncbi:hypothetical protein P9112_000520 [Eukaryota sp. TZLM1-RC]